MPENRIELGCWAYGRIGEGLTPEEHADAWADAGLTLGMSPRFGDEADDQRMLLRLLDRARERGVRVILVAGGLSYGDLARHGETAYRATLRKVVDAWGDHPAVFGCSVGDEPDAAHTDAACRAYRLQKECHPAWSPFCNLNPWWPDGANLGYADWGEYLDNYVRGARPDFLCYDCYSQMKPGDEGLDMYFQNLRYYHDAARRAAIPFWTALLSVGHFRYQPPTYDDFRWQLNTAVAHGARGALYFYFQTTQTPDNYRMAPIDERGERTDTFGWMRRAHLDFAEHVGARLAQLRHQATYHAGRAWGGWPRVAESSLVRDAFAEEGPDRLIVAEFTDEQGRPHVAVVNNHRGDSNLICITFAGRRPTLFRLRGVRWPEPELALVPGDRHGTASGEDFATARCWLAPGQMEIYRVQTTS